MNEFEQTRELRKGFLRAAYELYPGRANRLVGLYEIAEKLDLEFTAEGDIGKLMEVAYYLGEQGYIEKVMDDYATFSLTSKGIDEVEGNREKIAATTTNITFNAPVHSSVIGTHNRAELTNNFDFRAMEQRIEREGGDDKEELYEALSEIQDLLESGKAVDRGALSRFSEAMLRHEWFTGSVMQALLGFVTQSGG